MNYIYSEELYHHGVRGQKWGVRRYQYTDKTLTPEGRRHYGVGESRRSSSASKHLSGSGPRSSSDKLQKRKGLTDEQKARLKTAAKVGAAVAGTALVAYGMYKLNESYDQQIAASKARVSQMNAMTQTLPPSMAMQTKPKTELKTEPKPLEKDNILSDKTNFDNLDDTEKYAKVAKLSAQQEINNHKIAVGNETLKAIHDYSDHKISKEDLNKKLDDYNKAKKALDSIDLDSFSERNGNKIASVLNNASEATKSQNTKSQNTKSQNTKNPDASKKASEATKNPEVLKMMTQNELHKQKSAVSTAMLNTVHDYSNHKISHEELNKKLNGYKEAQRRLDSIDVDSITENLLKKNASTLRNLK